MTLKYIFHSGFLLETERCVYFCQEKDIPFWCIKEEGERLEL